jgi:hypothetical protein
MELEMRDPVLRLPRRTDLGYRRIHREVGRLSYEADRLTALGRHGAIAIQQRKALAEDLPVILCSPGSSHRESLLAVCPLKAQGL